MMQAPKNTKCNMVYKDYKHGLYLLELFVLWLKISKCNCTYNQCANCISIYLSCTSMSIVSNNRLEKYLCYVVMIRSLSGRWPRCLQISVSLNIVVHHWTLNPSMSLQNACIRSLIRHYMFITRSM